MPTPFFADMVRELCQEGGTGPLTPAGAVPGHRRFADAVPVGVAFHYTIAGIAHPGQWEVGTGQIDGGGRLVREQVMSSSNTDATVDFAPGLKTIALTVAARWFAASEAADAALASAIQTRQPLSTAHAGASVGASEDLLTVRRGTGWVNIPLATLPFRDADGRHVLSGGLSAQNGSAATPSIGFAGDTDTGLFRPGANMVATATAGAERARIDAAGNMGIGTSSPTSRLHVVGGGAAGPVHCDVSYASIGDTTTALRSSLNGGAGGGYLSGYSNDANLAHNCEFISGSGWIARGAVASRHTQEGGAHSWFGNTGLTAHGSFVPTERLRLEVGGTLRAASDNSQALGGASFRWAVVYAGSGAINTSDAREKAWRGSATPAEMRAARRIMDELGFYQWNHAIAAKGVNGARRHFGVRAQAIWAIMAAEGLIDPLDADGRPGDTAYAFLCWDEWLDGTDGTDGTDGADDPAIRRDRFGIRPDQLALFLIAAQEQRIAALEAAA